MKSRIHEGRNIVYPYHHVLWNNSILNQLLQVFQMLCRKSFGVGHVIPFSIGDPVYIDKARTGRSKQKGIKFVRIVKDILHLDIVAVRFHAVVPYLLPMKHIIGVHRYGDRHLYQKDKQDERADFPQKFLHIYFSL